MPNLHALPDPAPEPELPDHDHHDAYHGLVDTLEAVPDGGSEPDVCANCDGDGWVENNDRDRVDCSTCGGVGRVSPGFSVDDESKAAWAMRRLAAVRRRQARIVAAAAADEAKIDEWLAPFLAIADEQRAKLAAYADGEVSRLEPDARYFEHQLIGYHQQVLAENPKIKTLRLPDGEIASTGPDPKKGPSYSVEVADKDALVAWLNNEHPEAVRTKEEPDLPAINELVKAKKIGPDTDLPGARLVQKYRTFKVKPQVDQ